MARLGTGAVVVRGLYDMRADPHENTNLVGSTTAEEESAGLAAQLRRMTNGTAP